MTSRRPVRAAGRPIDWDDVRARLARATISEDVPAAEARRILDDRARALARVPPEPPQRSELLEVAMVELGRERCAIETRFVRQVIRFGEPTPIPEAPETLVGVTNLDGEVLAVFDLRPLLGLPVLAPTDASRILVLGEDVADVGVLVDRASEVTSLHVIDILRAPDSVAPANRALYAGATSGGLIVLSGASLLADERLFVDFRPGPA